MTAMSRKPQRWPLALIAAPAAVAVWSGWVGLGAFCGFGEVQPLPGIAHVHLNTAITLPIGVEAYGAYALWTWLGAPGASAATRRFARASAIGALALGCLGQVAYHLLAAAHSKRAPDLVIVLVACLPVVVVGLAAALMHLSGADRHAAEQAEAEAAERAAARERAKAEAAAARASAPAPGVTSARRKPATSARRKTAGAPPPPPGGNPEVTPDSAPEVPAISAPESPPAEVAISAPEPDGEGSADMADTEAQALIILAAEPDISGSALGRRLGKSEGYGRDLKRQLTTTP